MTLLVAYINGLPIASRTVNHYSLYKSASDMRRRYPGCKLVWDSINLH